jgi:PhnB protein
MNESYKPHGYASVSVYIMANGAQRVIDFLKKTFDAKQTRRTDLPDGSILHAEVQIDDTIVMIADAGGEFPAFPVWLHVYVPDVDATYQRALAAGGTSVQERNHLRWKPNPIVAAGLKIPPAIPGGSQPRLAPITHDP